MRIIVALHSRHLECYQLIHDKFGSKYDIIQRFAPITVKTEVNRNPHDIAAIILDDAFMSLGEEPQITAIYNGPFVGVYDDAKTKTGMANMGFHTTKPKDLAATMRRALQKERTQRPRILACINMQEPGRQQYLRILSQLTGYELVCCINPAQALGALKHHASTTALLVVGYYARSVVAKAYKAGFRGQVIAVCEDPRKEEEMARYGLHITSLYDFKKQVTAALQR